MISFALLIFGLEDCPLMSVGCTDLLLLLYSYQFLPLCLLVFLFNVYLGASLLEAFMLTSMLSSCIDPFIII